MEPNLIWIVALLLLAGLGGAALPLLGHFGPRVLHGLVALSAGIFLGGVLHLLADAVLVGRHGDHGHAHGGHGHGGHAHAPVGLADTELWLGLVAGFVGLFLLRRYGPGRRLREAHAHDTHSVTWRVAYLGLVFHAALAGFGLAPMVGGDLAWGLVGSFAAHKATEVLSLATLMRLAGVGGRRGWLLLLAFVAVTPATLALGHVALMDGLGAATWAMGLAGGTLLYVGLVDLLPEAFHQSDNRLRSLLLVLVGGAAGAALPGGDFSSLQAVPGLTVDVFLELAPFLLFGFAIAGLLSEWLDPKKIEPWLAGERARSVATASVVGAPLPLCSCSVVPVAATLRGAGAGRGATSAFLIATPETGVDSIAVTYGLMGPVMAVARPLAAVLSALGVGALVSRFGEEAPAEEVEPVESCCPEEQGEPEPDAAAPGDCCVHDAAASAEASGGQGPALGARLGRALRHGFVQMVDDLALPLVLGVVAAGVLAALIPAEAFTSSALEGPLGYLLMLAIGLPVYVCASASTPLAATLIAKGLSPGAALVLLLAAPATNLGSMLIVKRLIGGRGLAVHLVALAVATVLSGALFDLVLGTTGWSVPVVVGDHVHLLGHRVHLISALLLSALLLGTAWRKLGGGLVVAQRG